MRFIVMGLGAVGGTVAALLQRAGHDVVGVARPGPHLDAIQGHGLILATPRETFVAPLKAVPRISELRPGADDAILLAMKTQDTGVALDDILAAGFGGAMIVCLQNGLENERLAIRRFANVYGVCVALPSAYIEAGEVLDYGDPMPGILDVGRWPHGHDATSAAIAAALTSAGFSSDSVPDIQRHKAGKLLSNLANTIELACGPGAHWAGHYAEVRREGETALTAAGIAYATIADERARRGAFTIRPIDGKTRQGGSTWQSVARGAGSVETDYLNGEIVLLARQHGTEAPLNAKLCEIGRRIARGEIKAGSLAPADLT
jgi:2-dehydropantoate 2-reductase